MQAVRISAVGRAEVLSMERVARPVPGPGNVIIRVGAAGVNFADVNIRRGRYIMQPALPYTPGFEVAGVIDEVGSGVDGARLTPGLRVAALTLAGGGYAEYAVARAQHVVSLPATLTIEDGAAFLLQGLTAYHSLSTMGQLSAGETVLVQAAAGGVGTMSIQLARLLGAGRVIAAAGGPTKLKLTRQLGADDTVDYLRESFESRVNEITEGRGADLVLESVGGQMLERVFNCTAHMGRVVTLGNSSGGQADLNTVWSRLRTRCQSLVGFSLLTVLDSPELLEPAVALLLELIESGKLRIVVGGRYPLAEAAAAHTAMEERRTTGKVILKVASLD